VSVATKATPASVAAAHSSPSERADADATAGQSSALAASQKAQLEAALGRAPKKKVSDDLPKTERDDKKAAASADSKGGAGEQIARVAPLAFSAELWPDIVRAADLAGLTMQLAVNTALAGWQNGQLELQLPSKAKHLSKPSAVERLSEALSAYAGVSVKINLTETEDELVTPARLMEEAEQAAQAGAEASIRSDPVLAQLLSRVDGVIAEDSVRPVETRSD